MQNPEKGGQIQGALRQIKTSAPSKDPEEMAKIEPLTKEKLLEITKVQME